MDFTPEQREAIESRAKHLCVDAGAGSGKTRVLVERIQRLLEERAASLDEIVAITFTDKAAAEMRTRLRQTFRGKAPQNDAAEMSYWRELERRVDSARISTIHAFCMGLLKENALRAGLDPDFGIGDETAQRIEAEASIAATLHRLFAASDEAALRLTEEWPLSQLTDTLHAILQRRGLFQRIGAKYPMDDPAALMQRWEEDFRAEQERGLLAFRQAPEMLSLRAALEKLEGMCDDAEDLREWRRSRAVDVFTRIAEAGSAGEVKAQLARLWDDPPKSRGSKKNWESEEAFAAADKLWKKVESLLKPFAEPAYIEEQERRVAEYTCDLFGVARAVIADHDAAKRARNALDYDDLIMMAVALLREKPEVCARVARGIRFLLMDEFQDTDGLQLELARLLADCKPGPDLFIVGDAKQSIYLFRGAEVAVFQEERNRALKTIPLATNFRSAPEVLNFINDFFAASHLLNAVEAYTPMRTHRPPTGETRVEFMLTGADAGEDRLRADERRQREAEFIAQRIRELTAPDTPVRVWDNKAEAWRAPTCRDVAVLFRAMSNAHLYEEALRNAGVPYVLVGGRGFFRCQEVIDVINLLTVIVDPWDEIALLGFLRGPFAGLNDESVFLIAERGGLCPAFQSGVVPENITQATELSEARKLVGSLRARQEMRPEAFIRRVLEETGVEAVLLAQYHGLQKASNVRKLVDLAADFAATGARSLRALAAYLREAGEQEVREGEAPEQTEGLYAVTLMTVHKSKGLEFPVVIVPDMALKPQRGALTVPMHRDLGMAVRITGEMSDEKVSSRLGDALRNRIQEEERAEHARLLYVALTRARDYLILCGATNPPPGSWFGAIDAVYPVVDAPQDGGIAGVGWSAAVRTCVLSAAEQSAAPDPVVLWEEDTLRQRIEPVQGAASARRTFSISSILDFMAEGMDEQEERDEAEERPPSKAGAAAARARGTLVHRFFETWDFRAAPEACIASVLSETARTAEDYASLQTDLANIAARFFAQPLCAELAQSDALQREAPFLLRADNAVISGTIDALAGDLLIDYKTGRPDDRRTARYEWQLLLYAAAVRTLLGYTPTRGIVAYVDHDVYHPVELSPEQIDSALRQAREVVASMRAKGGQQRREGAVS